MTGWQITSTALSTAQVADVLALVRAARRADGVEPLSEHVMLHLRYDSSASPGSAGTGSPGTGSASTSSDRDFVITAGDQITGYAYLDAPLSDPESDVSAELVIRPDHRRQGLGRALVGEVAAASGGRTLRLWAHGDLPAAARLAQETGFERFRALWQMRRRLDGPLEPVALPARRRLRTFVPGQDEDEWLGLNGRAFAKHPEQCGWSRHDLELREREPWFDPAGFFIAETDGHMAGFHWTKVHPPGDQDPNIGEVYVVGVDPAEQGSGLGRAITLAGLHYLRDRGVAEAMLYADEDNVPAIRMYEALGFTRARIDAMYRQVAR
jgi:mycothiol synthase